MKQAYNSLIDCLKESIKSIEDLSYTPGSFRITQGQTRKNEIYSKGTELAQLFQRHLRENLSEVQILSDIQNSLIKNVKEFEKVVEKTTIAEGRNYAERVASSCTKFLGSLREAVEICNENLIKIEHLGKIPSSAWQLTLNEWDTGTGHLKDAIKDLEEIRKEGSSQIIILSDEEDGDNKHDDPHLALVENLISLLKGVKTVLRKIRTRCLQPLIEPVETIEAIDWLDELHDSAVALFVEVEELAVEVLPPMSLFKVSELSRRVAEMAQQICQIGRKYPGNPIPMMEYEEGEEKHEKMEENILEWFDLAEEHFDHLVSPILEHIPSR
jgi:hypothetical protein